jgi:hypothetical protein
MVAVRNYVGLPIGFTIVVAAFASGGLAALVFALQEREPLRLHAEPGRIPESRPA